MNTIESTQLSLFFSKIKEFTRDVNVWLTYISLLEDVESIRIAYAELFGTPKPGLENAWKSYEHWEKNEKAKANNREVYLKTFALWVTEEEHFVALGKAEEYSIARLKCYFEHVRSTEKRYIYEEVLIKFPNSLDIWTDYLVFTMPDKFKALQVAKRSVRNCPSSASLWSNLFLCLENLEKSIESNNLHRAVRKILVEPLCRRE